MLQQSKNIVNEPHDCFFLAQTTTGLAPIAATAGAVKKLDTGLQQTGKMPPLSCISGGAVQALKPMQRASASERTHNSGP